MNSFKHLKGFHISYPFTPKFLIREVSGCYMFSHESRYILDDNNDQYDWNKLAGISFTPVTPNKNAIMVGWRYNPKYDAFEVSPYFNVNFGKIMAETNQIVRVNPGELFYITINYRSVKINGLITDVPLNLKPNYWTSMKVMPWFGGNRTAPKDLTVYYNNF